MLAVALQAEVSAYIDAHAEEVDENGHPLVVHNGDHGGGLGAGAGAAGQRQAHRSAHWGAETVRFGDPAHKSRDTPILSPIALPARRRRACRLRDTRIRSR